MQASCGHDRGWPVSIRYIFMGNPDRAGESNHHDGRNGCDDRNRGLTPTEPFDRRRIEPSSAQCGTRASPTGDERSSGFFDNLLTACIPPSAGIAAIAAT